MGTGSFLEEGDQNCCASATSWEWILAWAFWKHALEFLDLFEWNWMLVALSLRGGWNELDNLKPLSMVPASLHINLN